MYHWLRRLISGPPNEARRAAGGRPAEAPPVAASADAAAPAPATHAAARAAAVPSFDQKDAVNSDYNRWLFMARPDDGLDTNAPENRILETLSGIAKARQSGADLMRRMPGLIPQLLQSLRSEHFAGADIARRISSDVVLVAAVIRLANSSMHGAQHGGPAIASVEHAVIVIGQEGLRQLITTVAFKPIIDLNSGHYTKLLAPRIWEQSERCAVANRMLAPHFGVEPFEAFLAGLVQNAGLLVSLRMMDQVAGDSKALGSAMFCARLLRDARQVSANIAQEWNFPASVTQAIGELDRLQKGASVSPMGRLLSLTDYLSKIKILAEQRQLDDADAALFHGLPDYALPCYAGLSAITDSLPVQP